MSEFNTTELFPLGLTLFGTLGFLFLVWQALQALKK